MPIKYVGRETLFKGKTLWEIVGNLKNLGVGRMIVRHTYQKYPEPTFFRVLKVAVLPELEPKPGVDRKVAVLVQKTFRGKELPNLSQIDLRSNLADYILIPKEQEAEYLKVRDTRQQNVLPCTVAVPPIMKEVLIKEMKSKGTSFTEDLKIPICYSKQTISRHRIAEEGETPSQEYNMQHLGTPASPNLYANIKTT